MGTIVIIARVLSVFYRIIKVLAARIILGNRRLFIN
jgi:hypothetical protein